METPDGPIVTADEVCRDVEACLRKHLPELAAAAELQAVKQWQQVPTEEALSNADVPGIAITIPGLTDAPTRDIKGVKAVWRVAVAAYDRGEDYADTTRRTRTWAALIRAVLVRHLAADSALVHEVAWVGEEYALAPAAAARTLGGGAVAVDVTVREAVGLPRRSPHPC